LQERLTDEVRSQVREFGALARELECTRAQLALAWCLRQPNVSTVILGASSVAQLAENLGSLEVAPRLTDDLLTRIDALFPVGPE
jgi:aryl-alcohol dehydrogenase-like predicted oxidoreductase